LINGDNKEGGITEEVIRTVNAGKIDLLFDATGFVYSDTDNRRTLP
jgi:hypothetical protein